MTAVPVPQSLLTPEVIEAISESLRVNPSWGAAADYAGITDKTLRRYRERAEAHQQRITDTTDLSELSALDQHPDYPYWEAHKAWQQARSRGELELVAKIRQIGLAGDWRALQALAKAGWPDRYADRVEVTGAGGGPLQIEALKAEALSRADEALAQIRAKRKAAGTEPEVLDAAPDSE